MSRPGAILIPLLGGFLLTVAVISWRSGWWTPKFAAAAPVRIETRRSQLRVVQVNLSSDPWAPVATAPVAAAKAVSAAEPAAEPGYAAFASPPVPRVDPANSPEQLEAPARKFARGANTGQY